MKRADVAIIGAGIVGAAIAAHLVQSGRRRVLVVDRAGVASGETGRPAGVVRSHLHSEAEVRLAVESLTFFRADPGRYGFVESGLLLLLPPKRAPEVAAVVERLREFGVDSHCLSAAEARLLEPDLIAADEVALWERSAGFINPVEATRALLQMAARGGAEIRTGAAATVSRSANGEVAGIRIGDEEIRCPQVVLAAGVASNQALWPPEANMPPLCGIVWSAGCTSSWRSPRAGPRQGPGSWRRWPTRSTAGSWWGS